MSVIPQEIPDFGSAQLAPRQNPSFTPGVGFTTEDYFVWSRLDGHTTLRDIILMVGLGTDRAIDILRKLRSSGAVLLPGETPDTLAAAPPRAKAAPPKAETAAPEPPARRPRPSPPMAIVDPPSQPVQLPMNLDTITVEEARALAEAVELTDTEKRRIIQMMRLVSGGDYFAILGVPRGVDKRELKRAYFRVSKEFHPDRHYAQELGSFEPWLRRIFETATRAFQVLSDESQRAAYLTDMGEEPSQVRLPDKAVQAAQRFERACVVEANGDRQTALRLFAAAIEDDPQPRYLRRAATCALALGELSDAERYAKNAATLRADDASYARILADVYRAGRKLDEAEKILLGALALPTISDLMARELEEDLKACSRERLRRRRDE